MSYVVVAGRVVVGAEYTYRQTGGRYRVTALAWDPCHWREVVVYVGLDRRDKDYVFATGPAEFCAKFDPVEPPAPAPEKVAGRPSTEGDNL